jgi:hypothetical protein
MAKLCLNMVVGEDATGLERSLLSIANLVDAWVVADVGTSRDTLTMIQEFFGVRGIPGHIVSVPFRHFAQVRNQALHVCRTSAFDFDYILLLDPGIELIVEDRRFRERLSAKAYSLEHVQTGVSFRVWRILGRHAGGFYRGVTREFLEFGGHGELLGGVAAHRFAGPADTIERARLDARLLTEELRVEQDPMMRARYTFYLGTTLSALGDLAGARRCYLDRAGMGFWEEEVYCATLYAARAGRALGLPAFEMLQELGALTNLMAHRGEALHQVAVLCRENGWWEQAYITAREAMTMQPPTGALFSEDWIYEYGLADELAVAAYWTGRHVESQQICEALLAGGRLPPDTADRITRNRDSAIRGREAAERARGEAALAAG